MMGQHEGQKALFSYQVDLESRVRADHPLRRVSAKIDFTFARAVVAHTYGGNGNVSVDPAILLKLMFLLFHENVRSERELVRRFPPSAGFRIKATFQRCAGQSVTQKPDFLGVRLHFFGKNLFSVLRFT